VTTASEEGTHCTPKSPVLNTSIRLSPKQANISTLHRPSPLTATSCSIRASSDAPTRPSAVNSPEANFSASPVMYSALRCERPAVRSVGISFVSTWAGEGNAGCVASKRAVNFLRIEAAAAPETWSRVSSMRDVFPIDSIACQRNENSCLYVSLPQAEPSTVWLMQWPKHTCCPMIPLASAVNGSTTSLNPSGLNILHCWPLISLSNRPLPMKPLSTSIKCASASFNSVSIVEFPFFSGDPTSGGASAFLFLLGLSLTITPSPPGFSTGALVTRGSAGRVWFRLARLSSIWSSFSLVTFALLAMRPTPDGVGVNGTGLIGLAVSAASRRCLFAGSGVEEVSDTASTLVVVGGLVRLVAPTAVAFLYIDSVASVAAPFVLPTLRAERRRDIVILLRGVCLRL
jgi:hypothetical protein